MKRPRDQALTGPGSALLTTTLRGGRILVRAGKAVNNVVAGCVSYGLTRKQQMALGIMLYDQTYRPSKRSLHVWEQRWFKRRLPAPPATILVGACGDGRELSGLSALGYDVHGFEPATRPFQVCHSRHADHGRTIVQASYDDLVRAVTAQSGPLADLCRRSFDAVILGWGSLTHIVDPSLACQVIEACAACTSGPVLASFYLRGSEPHGLRGRAYHMGAALGRGISWIRGRQPTPVDEAIFMNWGGFIRYYDTAEIRAMGQACGRHGVVNLTDPMAYVTFIEPDETADEPG